MVGKVGKGGMKQDLEHSCVTSVGQVFIVMGQVFSFCVFSLPLCSVNDFTFP
jgi:hypothetical protein